MAAHNPTSIPAHLPARLTITLWDFTWYTRAGAGEPFADLDEVFAAAVERGYNTVRICAMPYLLFGANLDTSALTFRGLGGEYAQRTRWYDVHGEETVNGRERLAALLAAARRHDCFVILSSWEYQQSPCFLAGREWYDALYRIEPKARFDALADALTDLIGFCAERGLADRIAYTELHNEVALGRLTDVVPADSPALPAMRPYLERAVERMRAAHPDQLFTACFHGVPIGELRDLPGNLDVGHFHAYVYGVLGELMHQMGIWDQSRPLPEEKLRPLLRDDAPPFAQWNPPAEDAWRMEATLLQPRMVYAHDWADPDRWDRWLYERYADFRHQMREVRRIELSAAADWANAHGVPAVIGEAGVGYTPLYSNFEEGPVGRGICEEHVRTCAELGYWGTVVSSNAAPHHPMWTDVALQRRLNDLFLGR